MSSAHPPRRPHSVTGVYQDDNRRDLIDQWKSFLNDYFSPEERVRLVLTLESLKSSSSHDHEFVKHFVDQVRPLLNTDKKNMQFLTLLKGLLPSNVWKLCQFFLNGGEEDTGSVVSIGRKSPALSQGSLTHPTWHYAASAPGGRHRGTDDSASLSIPTDMAGATGEIRNLHLTQWLGPAFSGAFTLENAPKPSRGPFASGEFCVRFKDVNPNSHAYIRGLRSNDILLAANGISASGLTSKQLMQLMLETRPPLLIRVFREKTPETVYEWNDAQGAATVPPDPNHPYPVFKLYVEVPRDRSLGLSIRGGSEFGLGVFVASLVPASVAEMSGIQVGDQILELNGISLEHMTHGEAVDILRRAQRLHIKLMRVGKVPKSKVMMNSLFTGAGSHQLPPSLSRAMQQRGRELPASSQSASRSKPTSARSTSWSNAGRNPTTPATATPSQQLPESVRTLLRQLVQQYVEGLITVQYLCQGLHNCGLLPGGKRKKQSESKERSNFSSGSEDDDSGTISNGSRSGSLAFTPSGDSDEDSSHSGLTCSSSSRARQYTRLQQRNLLLEEVRRHIRPVDLPFFDKRTAPICKKWQQLQQRGRTTSLSPVASARSKRDTGRSHRSQEDQNNGKVPLQIPVHVMGNSIRSNKSKDNMHLAALPPPSASLRDVIENLTEPDPAEPSKFPPARPELNLKNVSTSPLKEDKEASTVTTAVKEFREAWSSTQPDPSESPTEKKIRVDKTLPTLGMSIQSVSNEKNPEPSLPRISAIQPTGAAFACGRLRVGQEIVEVNGQSLKGLSHAEVARKIAEAFRDSEESFMELLVRPPATGKV